MTDRFELFVAARYLRAKRKTAVISVITVISVIGVAAGVMALIIALAINNGFKTTLQKNLLGATAHVNILEKQPGAGIANWRELTAKLRAAPHVRTAAAVLYGQIFLSGPQQSGGAVLKGIQLDSEIKPSGVLAHLKQGSAANLGHSRGFPGIILGARLAQNTGLLQDSVVQAISPQGEITPLGPRPAYFKFRVVGIFETGFFDLDNAWAYATLPQAQRVFGIGDDVVNSIELEVDDLDRADAIARDLEQVIGPNLAAVSWKEQNRAILGALRMEKAVTVVTIGLIQLVAALNILIALVMMVMEKHRDIAILSSMGARREQIRNVFMLQGILIGVVGTAIGLLLGYTLSYFADHYRWIPLNEDIYSLSFVPFDARAADGIWVAAVAVLVSFVATIYPARNATRISPVETLRYE